MGGGRSRKVGTSHKQGRNPNKRKLRSKFEDRHIDQVWDDIRKPPNLVHVPGVVGPMGTTARSELDEDVPGYGKHYCIACSRYFQDASALAEHNSTRPHKRKVKMLLTTPKPHTQKDADRAAGMGEPDNGPRLRATDMALDE